MFRSVRLNRSVTLCISGLRYVNMIHFFVCVCVGVFFVFCVLIFLFSKFWMICNGKTIIHSYGTGSVPFMLSCLFCDWCN